MTRASCLKCTDRLPHPMDIAFDRAFDRIWVEFRDMEAGGTMTEDRLLRGEQSRLRREAGRAHEAAEHYARDLAAHEAKYGRLGA